MDFLFSTLVLVGGLIGLGIGAELTVNCSIKTAWRLGLSPFLIGLTLVSIGTSIPEISIGIAGGLDRLAGLETSGIVIGDKIGSVLNQMTIILGICGLLGTLTVSKKVLRREGGATIASLLLFFVIIMNGEISIFEGFLMIIAYISYILFLFLYGKDYEVVDDEKVKGFKICSMEQPAKLDILLLIVGVIIVAIGSDSVLRGGIELARFLGVEQSVIGFIFIGLGTGLPELIVSVRAIRKGDISLSIGNLLGSNITNLLLSTGVGSIIAGFSVDYKIIWYDTPLTILIVFLTLIFLGTGKKLDRKESISLIFIYLALVFFIFKS